MPLGFSQYAKDGTKKVLNLNKTLYGLWQSPRAFWKYITKKLEACALAQSRFNPCLFVGTKVIWIVYVDDAIFWSKNTADIDSSAMQLHELGVNLEQEDDAPEFLGVTLEHGPETNLLEIKQTGLIKWVIEALGLDDGIVKEKHTSSESNPLVKNLNGEAASGAFSYSRVVRHTRPDITSWYKFSPKHQHELALKCFGRYLKQTSDCGMLMNPTSNVCKIDAYPMLTLQGCMIMRITQIPLSA